MQSEMKVRISLIHIEFNQKDKEEESKYSIEVYAYIDIYLHLLKSFDIDSCLLSEEETVKNHKI